MPDPSSAHPGLDPADPPPLPGRLVRHAREQALLTQQDLAARAGVSTSTISRLEQGRRPARWDLVQHLLSCLDLQPRVSLETLDTHLAGQLKREAARPPLEWLLDAVTDVTPALRLAHAEGLVVDGALAARLHGVALPLGDIELLVPPTCSTGQLQRSGDQFWIGFYQEDEDLQVWWCRRHERSIVARRVEPLPPVVLVVPPTLDPHDADAPDAPDAPGPVRVAALSHLRLSPDQQRLLRYALRHGHAG